MFVEAGQPRDRSAIIEVRGESTSSSSSSLVYDFLRTDDALRDKDWVPDSPINLATEAAVGDE